MDARFWNYHGKLVFRVFLRNARIKGVIIKIFQLFSIGIVIIYSAIVGCFLYNQRNSHEKHLNQPKFQPFISNAFEMKGINFTHNIKGYPLIKLRASSVFLTKKKIGFLKIGLFKQIEFRDLVIDYYEYNLKNIPRLQDNQALDNKKFARNLKSDNLDIVSIISKDYNIMRIKHIAGVLAENVILNFHITKDSMTQFRGKYLEVLKNKTILFKENVTVQYKNRILISNEIIFSPEKKKQLMLRKNIC